ncbi:hypothetical protein DFJ77DRAFT_512364 [Powellomyces hirtus]|nr:hypothetical protein DFJ77DRAFT_512364 [Powellomyces hirtus]
MSGIGVILAEAAGDRNGIWNCLGTSLWAAAFDAASQLSTLADAHIQAAMQLQRTVIDPMRGHLREMKIMRHAHQDHGREITRQLQNVYTETRLAKQEYDKAQLLASECVDSLSKSQLRADKKKDLERLQAKATAAIERVTIAEEVLRKCEEKRAAAQQDYFETKIPAFFEDVHTYEDKRLSLIRKGLNDVASIDCVDVNSRVAVLSGIQDMINSIDLRKDSTLFEQYHLDRENKDANQVSVRGLVGAMKASRASVKRGDTASGWSSNYLVLMAEDMLLYCFDGEDSEQPREIITLASSQVYSLDDSYYGRAHCFQLILDTDVISYGPGAKPATSPAAPGSKITYNFIAESANDKHEWIKCLRQFGYCCRECAGMYGDAPTDETERPSTRSLVLWVMEAKDLKLPGSHASSRSLNPYCVLLFNDVKQARTSIKSDEAPFWGEEFRFNDIPPCQKRLRLLFFSGASTRLQKDQEVGYVSMNLSKVKDSTRFEEWHQIRPFHRGDSGAGAAAVGSVRIAYQLSNERSLPMPLYSELLETVTEQPLTCVQFIGERLVKPQPREEFARTILNILVAFDRDVAGVQVLARAEIAKTINPNIMFRGNSIATKVLDQYMKMVGEGYLHGTLQSLIRGVYTSKDSCEVDPARLPQGKETEMLKRNWKRLLNHATIFWEAIQRSADKCPPELVAVFADMIRTAEARFDTQVKYAAVSGFIFLRFFCPAILSPKLFGIMNEHPPDITARTLTLLAKILQNLANLSEFEAKEPYMAPANSWIAGNLPGMRLYIQQVSTLTDGQTATRKPRIDLRRESAALHYCINAIWSDLHSAIQVASAEGSNAITADSPLMRLIPVMERLNAATEEQEQTDGLGSQLELTVDEGPSSPLSHLLSRNYDNHDDPPNASGGIDRNDDQFFTLHQYADARPQSPTSDQETLSTTPSETVTLKSRPTSIRNNLNLRAQSEPFAPHSMQEGILSNAIAAMDDEDGDEFYLAPMSPAGPTDTPNANSWKHRQSLSLSIGRKKERDVAADRRDIGTVEGTPPMTSALPPKQKSNTALDYSPASPKSSPNLSRKLTSGSGSSQQKSIKTSHTFFSKGAKVGTTLKNMLAGGQTSIASKPIPAKKVSLSKSNPDLAADPEKSPKARSRGSDPETKRSHPRIQFGSVRKKGLFATTEEDDPDNESKAVPMSQPTTGYLGGL